MAKTTAVILADCQGPPIAWALRQLQPLRQRLELHCFENWRGRRGSLDAIPAALRGHCKLLIYQVGQAAPAKAALDTLPRDCRLLCIGSPAATCLYPRRGWWPVNPLHAGQIELDPELADALAISLARTADGVEDFLARYYGRPVSADIPIDRLLELDQGRQEALDDVSDVPLASFIASHLRTTKLFHTISHPTNALYYFMIRGIVESAHKRGIDGFEDLAGMQAELAHLEHTGPELLGTVQAPVHPDVITALSLEYCSAESVYRNAGHPDWTHRDYIAALYGVLRAYYAQGG